MSTITVLRVLYVSCTVLYSSINELTRPKAVPVTSHAMLLVKDAHITCYIRVNKLDGCNL